MKEGENSISSYVTMESSSVVSKGLKSRMAMLKSIEKTSVLLIKLREKA